MGCAGQSRAEERVRVFNIEKQHDHPITKKASASHCSQGEISPTRKTSCDTR